MSRYPSRALIYTLVTLLCWYSHPAIAGPPPKAPTKIAVFPFELDDFSAVASTGAAPDTSAALLECSKEAQRLIEGSGQYKVVVVRETDTHMTTGLHMRDCGACDADIAAKLGADEAMLGVITKVSMTEFRVQIQTRDSRTGQILATYKTDLLVGAYYAWSRGVRSLLKSQMLASQ